MNDVVEQLVVLAIARARMFGLAPVTAVTGEAGLVDEAGRLVMVGNVPSLVAYCLLGMVAKPGWQQEVE